jgi:hypothetical protein
MDQVQKLRDEAARLIWLSQAVSNPKDVVRFLALAAEATQAAEDIAFADAARLENRQVRPD